MHSIPVPKPVCRRFNFHSCSASSHLLHAALRPPLVEQLCAQSRSTLLELMHTGAWQCIGVAYDMQTYFMHFGQAEAGFCCMISNATIEKCTGCNLPAA
mmetsp:Transcript_8003/g.15801  ORF Transcript_8003/g.15801 Transcript_8003/m.15801 type:complete len:99 (+) Transcript_8003:1729-2025(+)